MLRSVLLVTVSGDGSVGGTETVAFDDVALPFSAFRGFDVGVTIATPRGGALAVSRRSIPEFTVGRLGEARLAMRATVALRDIDPAAYGAIFVAHAVDGQAALEVDPDLRALLEFAVRSGRVVATVGNGSAVLLGLRGADGDAYLRGRRVTVSYDDAVLASASERDRERAFVRRFEAVGAEVLVEPEDCEHVSVDATLVTAQNPASAVTAATLVLTFLRANRARRSA